MSTRIVWRGGTAEIEEKKSRFIATVRPVRSEEEAQAFLAEMRKKYWDARHNCHAFVIGERNELAHSSDDGEPAGTAGHPMLDVLLKEELHDVAVVVTRYFGGTLLGTGGLVRAYTAAVQAGLAACEILEEKVGVLLRIRAGYADAGKLQYLLREQNVPLVSSDFGEMVEFVAALPAEEKETFRATAVDVTGGRIEIEEIRPARYAVRGGEVILRDEE